MKGLDVSGQSSNGEKRQSRQNIREALESRDRLEDLKSAVGTFDSAERQIFLEALQAVERSMNLETERLDIRAALRELSPVAVGSAMGYLIMLALIPPAAAAGAIVGGSLLGSRNLLAARNQKREIIGRLRELRDAAIHGSHRHEENRTRN